MRHAILWAGLLLWFPGSLRSQTQPATATRLVVNGGFEEKEAGWQFISTGAKATGQLDEAEKHEGKYSYKLTNQSALTPNLFARIFQVLPGLRPYSTYRISCWVKGRRPGST